MINRLTLIGCFILLLFAQESKAAKQDSLSFKLFDKLLFFDGYAKPVDVAVPKDIIRLSNANYVKKITTDQLALIGNQLKLRVTLNPACDNYDRIGNVSLVFVKKGEAFQKDGRYQKLEIARFITPFMNMNKDPKQVIYTYDVAHIATVLNTKTLQKDFDFWIEFEIFGVPYAAQKQVEGCKDRNDTFYGSLSFTSVKEKVSKQKALLIPVFFKDSLNNYKNTDTLGKTIRNFEFQLKTPIKQAKLYLITSNHGANRGGEEYVRRTHELSLDHKLIYQYQPGGNSCELYRVYNTQSNGIYGKVEKTEKDWTSWNNWCPGSPIPIRIIELEDLKAGKHQISFAVPDALFKDKEGYILTSLFLQAK